MDSAVVHEVRFGMAGLSACGFHLTLRGFCWALLLGCPPSPSMDASCDCVTVPPWVDCGGRQLPMVNLRGTTPMSMKVVSGLHYFGMRMFI